MKYSLATLEGLHNDVAASGVAVRPSRSMPGSGAAPTPTAPTTVAQAAPAPTTAPTTTAQTAPSVRESRTMTATRVTTCGPSPAGMLIMAGLLGGLFYLSTKH